MNLQLFTHTYMLKVELHVVEDVDEYFVYLHVQVLHPISNI